MPTIKINAPYTCNPDKIGWCNGCKWLNFQDDGLNDGGGYLSCDIFEGVMSGFFQDSMNEPKVRRPKACKDSEIK